ncbi:helix-turn-helix domain-containing protein [Lactobacillus gasseri]
MQYCLNHDKNYSEASVRFNFSYQQVYSWIHIY